MTIYAIGDIHGKAAMLKAMLDELTAIPIREEDIILFLGDYIDRGEDSSGVIDLLLELRRTRPNTVFLRGNHEQLLLSAAEGTVPEPDRSGRFMVHSEGMILWLQNGGIDTLVSYDVSDFSRWQEFIPIGHWDFFQNLEMEYVTEAFHFVHAGLLPPGESWEGEGQDLDPRLWIREPFISSDDSFGGRTVVFGHTPQRTGRPLVLANKVGLDTAAFGGGPLTCGVFDQVVRFNPNQARFIQIPYIAGE
jgi:serine/threonine protein phosphatase 1